MTGGRGDKSGQRGLSMKKRIMYVFLAFLISVSLLNGCAADEGNRYILVPETFPMRIQIKPDDEITEDEITLYFVNGGGSCVVRPCTTASGAAFTISSPRQVSFVRNGSLYNADQGIDPDFTISKPETFYDREKLVEFIHDLP